jgi:hypothetical protein
MVLQAAWKKDMTAGRYRSAYLPRKTIVHPVIVGALDPFTELDVMVGIARRVSSPPLFPDHRDSVVLEDTVEFGLNASDGSGLVLGELLVEGPLDVVPRET